MRSPRRATVTLRVPSVAYPDLVVHRVLKLQLAYEQLGGKDALSVTPWLIGKGASRCRAFCRRSPRM